MLSTQYTDLAPPMPGHVYLVAHSTTAVRYRIPEDWKGKIVTISSTTDDLFILLGSANVMIESAEVAQLVSTPEVLSPNWGSGQLIPAGSSVPLFVPSDSTITHFAVDSSGATGKWCATVASGGPTFGEPLPATLGAPLIFQDAGHYRSLTVDSGAVTVSAWRSRSSGYVFSAANKPDLLTAVGVGASMIRPAVEFVTGSSESLQCTDSTLAAALGGANPFTLYFNARRGATGAAHTIFSVGTTGSDNGRWDVTYDASDDIVITRVTSGGSSAASTYATTINGANTVLITFDGTTHLLWVNGTSQALAGGPATGNVGTTTKATVGARAYNTSTIGQYANAQISDLMVFPECFTGEKLTMFQDWIRRRAGL